MLSTFAIVTIFPESVAREKGGEGGGGGVRQIYAHNQGVLEGVFSSEFVLYRTCSL